MEISRFYRYRLLGRPRASRRATLLQISQLLGASGVVVRREVQELLAVRIVEATMQGLLQDCIICVLEA